MHGPRQKIPGLINDCGCFWVDWDTFGPDCWVWQEWNIPTTVLCVSSFKAKQDGLSFGLSELTSTFCTEMKMCTRRQLCFSSEDSWFICITTHILYCYWACGARRCASWPVSPQPDQHQQFYLNTTQHLRSGTSPCNDAPLIHPLFIHPRFVLAYGFFFLIRWDKNVPSCYEAGLCWCALSLTIALLKFYCWCIFVFYSRGHVVAEITT